MKESFLESEKKIYKCVKSYFQKNIENVAKYKKYCRK